MKKLFVLIALLFTIELFSAQSGIVLKDLNNKEFKLDNYIGKKVVMLNFWATWCSPCKKELPVLDKLYNDYKDEGFVVLSVSLDDSSEFSDVKSFISSNKLTLPVLLDPNSECSDYYNPSKDAPYSILFDKSGKIIKKYLGFHSGDEEEIENLIKSLLKKEKGESDDFEYRLSTKIAYIRYDPNADDEVFKNYEFLITRTNLFGAFKNYSLSTSIHTENFLTKTRYLRENDYKFEDYRLEKITFKTNFSGQKILLGDYHITQGKGITLSLTKKDDLGIDTTLLGGKTNLKYKFINTTLFVGVINNVNLNPDTNILYDNKYDLVMGSSVDFSLLKDSLILSLNYNRIAFKEPKFIFEKSKEYSQQALQVVGASLSYKQSKKLETYLEVDTIFDNYYNEEKKLDSPLAIYASLSYNFNKFTILQEFKRYKEFLLGFKSDLESIAQNDKATLIGFDSIYYNNLPSLEKKGEKIRDLGDDIWGVRTKIYYKLSKKIKPYFNYLYSHSYAHNNRITHHIYSGAELYFNNKKSKVDISLTLRLEKEDYDDIIESNETENYYGFNFDTSFYINSYISLDMKGFFHQTEKSINTEGTYDFQDIEATVSVALWKQFFISYLYNRYNMKNLKDTDFHGVELKYKYKDYLYTKLFYGSIRGGQKCIGGVCKDYPSFKGLKVDFVVSY